MSSKDFLVAHGEKIALVLVVGASGWSVYSTMTNPQVHPKDISEVSIEQKVKYVEGQRRILPPPQLKVPGDYVAALRNRLDTTLPTPIYTNWLTTAPDVGPAIDNGVPLCIYEALAPQVAARDLVGTVELTITLPESIHPDGRLSDAPSKSWKARGGEVENRVDRVGVFIDYSIGNGPVKPLVTSGIAGGFVPLPPATGGSETSANNELKVIFPADSAWETYTFHIRLAVKATGFSFDPAKVGISAQSVLVYAGRMTTSPDWLMLEKDLRLNKAETVAQFTKATTAPTGLTLAKDEQVYASKDAICSVAVTSPTRFAFDRPVINDDESVGAGVLVTKLIPALPAAKAAQAKWLFQPESFKLKPKDVLAGKRTVLDPRKSDKTKLEVDLGTPFALVEVKREVNRILYYELVTKSRAASGGQRDLDIKPKAVATDVAVFRNVSTGQNRSFARLVQIAKTKDDAIIYPDFVGKIFNEIEEFRKNPATFQQRDLEPPKPVFHDAEEANGPLADIHKRTSDAIYQTDTKYVEFPDGRVFFWDNVNKTLRNFVIPGSEAEQKTKRDAASKPAAAPASTPAASAPK
jgi:hypothetical protein